jgi:hypothetical protein
MNTIIALMLVTSSGSYEVATFNTRAECLEAKAQVENFDSFCYEREPTNVDQAIDQLAEIMTKMKQKLDELKEEKQNPNTI